MFKTSDQTDKLDAAMAKMQAELKPAIKDKQNPHFRSDYLTLAGAVDSARDALAKHGLNVTQWPVDSADGRVHLITRIACSGQWMQSEFSIPVTKQDAQGYGSATTYIRRFAFMAAIGIAPEDDDGNAAVEQAQARPYVSKHDSKPAPHPGQLKPISAPAPVAATPAPQAEVKPATEENKTPAAAKKPYFDKIKTSAWTKEQLGTYAKMYFGKSDANALTLNELMNFSNTVTSKTFDEVFNFGEDKT